MVSRLTLADPAIDSEGTEFPYVDVRIAYASTLGASKSGSVLVDGLVRSPFNIELKVRFYRLSSDGTARIFLAEDLRPVERIFIVPGSVPDPGGDDRTKLFNFFSGIWFGTTPSLASLWGVDMDDFRDQSGPENPFEAVDVDDPNDHFPMIECLEAVLRVTGGPDFVGLTVVEDS
jgi:hypothetical protein